MIQKADKGNNIVMLDKISHISAIEKILNDHTKFPNLDISAGQGINFFNKPWEKNYLWSRTTER